MQKDVFWSKDILFFEAKGAGRSTIPFDVPADGRYELVAQVAHSPDYGTYVTQLDGKATNSAERWSTSQAPMSVRPAESMPTLPRPTWPRTT